MGSSDQEHLKNLKTLLQTPNEAPLVAKQAAAAARNLGQEFGASAAEAMKRHVKDADLAKLAQDSFVAALSSPAVVDKLASVIVDAVKRNNRLAVKLAMALGKFADDVNPTALVGPGIGANDGSTGDVKDLAEKAEALAMKETPRADEPGGSSGVDDVHTKDDVPADPPPNAQN